MLEFFGMQFDGAVSMPLDTSAVQVLLEALLDAVGPTMVPTDSSALLNGLVEAQTQLKLLHRVPFLTPTYKVTMMRQQQAEQVKEEDLC